MTDLTEAELLTLAALARAILRLDGAVSAGEREALVALPSAFRETDEQTPSSPYRAPATPNEALSQARFHALLERAAREISDESALRAAAAAVDRPEAQTAIFAALADLAFADGLHPAEGAALAWLEALWGLTSAPTTGG